MTIKIKTKRRKVAMKERKPASQSSGGNINNKIDILTRQINQMTTANRDIKLSGLGRLAFDAGNSISQFFGAGKIFGSGAYKMRGGNTSWNTTNQVPVMHSNGTSVRMSNREYIGEISSSTGFIINSSLRINPGQSTTFPYLSAIAANFQEYKFYGLCFEFKSTSADALNSTNTALGTVMMAAQYDTLKPLPTGKLEIMNEMWSSDTKPSENLFLPIECSPAENPMSVMYIDTTINNLPYTVLPADRFADVGRLIVATQGSQAVATVGELYVTYDVELKKPALASVTGPLAGNGYSVATSGPTTLNPLGTVNYETSYNCQCSIIAALGVATLTFPAGKVGSRYFVNICYTVATTSDLVITALVGGSRVPTFSNRTIDSVENGAITQYNDHSVVLEQTAINMTLSWTVTIVGASFLDVHVVQVSDDYV